MLVVELRKNIFASTYCIIVSIIHFKLIGCKLCSTAISPWAKFRKHCILLVNNHGYNFPVEIGAATDWKSNIKLRANYIFMLFELDHELRNDYSSAATIWGVAINW